MGKYHGCQDYKLCLCNTCLHDDDVCCSWMERVGALEKVHMSKGECAGVKKCPDYRRAVNEYGM